MTQKRILIVDDEIIIAREIEARLSGLGYEITGIATTRIDAVSQALQTRPDLVLMDINLRGESDGIEAATEIRSHFSVPVIFLTAFTDDETLERAREVGPYGYIVKPFNERELLANIEMALHKHEAEIRKQLQIALDAADYKQRRIGQDLHDSIQQDLAGLGMLAQTLVESLRKSASERDAIGARQPEELASSLVDGIVRAHEQVRVIARGLVPSGLESNGLMNALSELALQVDVLEGITCVFKCEQPVILEDGVVSTHLFRIAQEAVTNALKHAQAEHILIELELNGGQPILRIADDGIGFEGKGLDGNGIGVRTMGYRASLIGGSLAVEPVESGGTVVTCRLSGESRLR